MTEDAWDKILTLLGVMIMADGRVRDAEVTAFVDGVSILQGTFEPGVPSAESAVRAWYDFNETRIREISQAEPFETAITPYLADLSDLPNRQILLDQLGAIADSDMHRDQTEGDLLTLAAAFWGLVRVSPSS